MIENDFLRSARACAIACVVAFSFSNTAEAADVWVQFGAAWETELDKATPDGVTDFDASEKLTIETHILTQLNTVYSAYNLNFFTSDPGGTREILNFGATTTSTSTFGLAPLDFGNVSAPGSTARVFTANFSSFIEAGDDRADQINEIATALGGTGAHELLHTFGARHQAAYSACECPSCAMGITPANYANTTGLQNQHIMATGSTGLNELERESMRTLSPWSKVILDVAGGTSLGGISLVNSPVTTAYDELINGDAGSAAAMAQSVALQLGETSGRQVGMVRGDLNTDGFDVDVYGFFAGVGTVTAELWSIDRFSTNFNGMLTLYDTDGVTPLYTNDNVFYSGDTYDAGTQHELDPFLVNIPIAIAGTYFLEVKAFNGSGELAGDDYILLWDAAIPEPGRTLLCSLACAMCLLQRRRR